MTGKVRSNYFPGMNTHIPETGLNMLLYAANSVSNRAIKLDIEKLLTNCNMYLLDQVDSSNTRGMVTCVPIEILRAYVPDVKRQDFQSELQYKQHLFDYIRTNVDLVSKFNVFFKPIFTKDAVTKKGWETNHELNNIVEVVNAENSDTNLNKDLWLSNMNIAALMKSYTLLSPSTTFLGVLYLSCFDNFSEVDMNRIYSNTALYREMNKIIHAEEKKRHLGLIVSRSHWSSIIIDTQKRECYHFCSGGNRPMDYKKSEKNLYIYSASRSFTCPEGNATKLSKAPKMAIFKQLMNAGYKVYMNEEACQILSGECGMFASMFLIFYCIGRISDIKDIKALYNSFSFLGDKSMGMYKDLLFWRDNTLNPDVTTVTPDRIELWKESLTEQHSLASQLTANIVVELNTILGISNRRTSSIVNS